MVLQLPCWGYISQRLKEIYNRKKGGALTFFITLPHSKQYLPIFCQIFATYLNRVINSSNVSRVPRDNCCRISKIPNELFYIFKETTNCTWMSEMFYWELEVLQDSRGQRQKFLKIFSICRRMGPLLYYQHFFPLEILLKVYFKTSKVLYPISWLR